MNDVLLTGAAITLGCAGILLLLKMAMRISEGRGGQSRGGGGSSDGGVGWGGDGGIDCGGDGGGD